MIAMSYPDPRFGPYLPVPRAIDPATGTPYSDKSKVVAGLLQLIPGLFSIGGIGRLYMGSTLIGVLQLVSGFIAWIMFWCLGWLFVPLFAPAICWLWFVIDAVILFAGSPKDSQGYLLRP